MIKSKDLDNRMAGQEGAEMAIQRMRSGKTQSAEEELAALRAKIEAVRTLPPPPVAEIYDGAIWAKGRDATIAAILAEE